MSKYADRIGNKADPAQTATNQMSMLWCYPLVFPMKALILSDLYTIPDTCANSVDPDETAH